MNRPHDRPVGVSGIRRGVETKALVFQELDEETPLVVHGGGRSAQALPPAPRPVEPPRPKGPSDAELLAQALEKVADLELHVQDVRREERERAERERQQAYQQGVKEGHIAGEMAGKTAAQATMDMQLAQLEQRMGGRIQQVEERLDAIFLDWEARILELALAVARKIVGDACEAPGVVATHAVREALRKLGAEAKVILRVHPEDLTVLERDRPLWTGRNTSRRITLLEDETVGRGGLLVETDAGSIDARIPRMTELVEKVLAEAMAEEKARLEQGG